MATFKDLENKMLTDPTLLGQLVINPKTAINNAGINLTSKEDVKKLEAFVRMTQAQLKVNAGLVGINIGKVAFGIGFTCCNGRSLQKINWGINPPM